MAKVENVGKLVAELGARAKAGTPRISVVVGFTAAYAVYVHENLEARHTNGQAKFLEQPARLLGPELGEIIREAVKDGASWLMALLMAGLRLQREAMLLCPVDTGNLRASAFARPEEGVAE